MQEVQVGTDPQLGVGLRPAGQTGRSGWHRTAPGGSRRSSRVVSSERQDGKIIDAAFFEERLKSGSRKVEHKGDGIHLLNPWKRGRCPAAREDDIVFTGGENFRCRGSIPAAP